MKDDDIILDKQRDIWLKSPRSSPFYGTFPVNPLSDTLAITHGTVGAVVEALGTRKKDKTRRTPCGMAWNYGGTRGEWGQL